jgi:L-histidine Nalpha-methyltransferase
MQLPQRPAVLQRHDRQAKTLQLVGGNLGQYGDTNTGLNQHRDVLYPLELNAIVRRLPVNHQPLSIAPKVVLMDGTVAGACRHEAAFRCDVLAGLSRGQKSLPCRWLYDNRGCELFEAITRLDEYYATRTESSILREHIQDLSEFAGKGASLFEYGAGAGIKAETVLQALRDPLCYLPIDIAGDLLERTVTRIRARFPRLEVKPIIADFMQDFSIPADVPGERRVGFFPGSTIGNLSASEAVTFLRHMRGHVGAGGRAIIGVDLKKDVQTILAAYDDQLGVTAEFNLNLLIRINRELGANFQLERFEHCALWNESDSCVEMHLVSLASQSVKVGDRSFHFHAGERIHTESSRKYHVDSFAALAMDAGWRMETCWTDNDGKFSVVGLTT